MDRHVDVCRARDHPSGEDASKIRIVVKDAGEHGKGRLGISLGWRNVVENQLEQGRQVVPVAVRFKRCPAVAARSKKRREVELHFIGTKTDKQVEDLLMYFVCAGVRAVYLVDDNDRSEPKRKGLGEHEFGLWHRTLSGIDEQ